MKRHPHPLTTNARRRLAALALLIPAAGSTCTVAGAQSGTKPTGSNRKETGKKNGSPAVTVKPAGKAAAPAAAPAPPAAPAAPTGPAAAGAGPGMIRLDFHGTNIDTVLQAYSMAFKWTVVKDPACTGEVTVMETEPLDQESAMEVLQALLEVRGFTAQLRGKILKVLSLKRAVASSTTVRVTAPGEDKERNEVIRAVIPLTSAEAPTLAKDLQPLISEGASIIGLQGSNALIITDTASNIRALRQIIGALDQGSENAKWKIFHLKHVPAKQMVEIINQVFQQIAPRTPPMPMGQPGQPPPPPQPGQKSQDRNAVAAVDDERTNSVIVVGPNALIERVEEIITELDEGLNPHNETKVYEVKFAEALKLAQMINDALVGGTAGQPRQQQQQQNFNPFGNPFESRAQGTQTASYSIGQTRIVADTRTNKLIITADSDTMAKVQKLLDDLDQQVEYATTTFSVPLKNANADDMAYVLSQAFGTESPQLLNPFGGFFGFGGGNGSRESRRDRRIKRRLQGDQNDSSSSRLGGNDILASASTGFKPDDPIGRQLADAAGGERLSPELQRLAQFFYDPGYGSRRGQTDVTTGRNASGKYVNLLQLRGNVLVTPERNTNSLIITTSPENEGAVRDLIKDLDVEVKQVLLEALVVEVTLNRNRQFGVDYLFNNLRDKVEGIFPVLPAAGPLGAGLASGFRATIVRGDFRAILTAVDRDDRIRILSTPSVFTANNQQAEIEVTNSIPYLRGTTVGFGGATSSNVDFIDVGLILNVTPRITSEGMVAVDVYQEDSNLVEFRDVGNDAQAPVTTQRVTDTSVTLRDGDTLVLSGLQKHSLTNSKSKVPILGNLPLLGPLFRSTNRRDERTELIVFLTPRVINNANEGRDLSQKELKRIQKQAPGARPHIPPVEREKEPMEMPERKEKDERSDRKGNPLS